MGLNTASLASDTRKLELRSNNNAWEISQTAQGSRVLLSLMNDLSDTLLLVKDKNNARYPRFLEPVDPLLASLDPFCLDRICPRTGAASKRRFDPRRRHGRV